MTFVCLLFEIKQHKNFSCRSKDAALDKKVYFEKKKNWGKEKSVISFFLEKEKQLIFFFFQNGEKCFDFCFLFLFCLLCRIQYFKKEILKKQQVGSKGVQCLHWLTLQRRIRPLDHLTPWCCVETKNPEILRISV